MSEMVITSEEIESLVDRVGQTAPTCNWCDASEKDAKDCTYCQSGDEGTRMSEMDQTPEETNREHDSDLESAEIDSVVKEVLDRHEELITNPGKCVCSQPWPCHSIEKTLAEKVVELQKLNERYSKLSTERGQLVSKLRRREIELLNKIDNARKHFCGQIVGHPGMLPHICLCCKSEFEQVTAKFGNTEHVVDGYIARCPQCFRGECLYFGESK